MSKEQRPPSATQTMGGLDWPITPQMQRMSEGIGAKPDVLQRPRDQSMPLPSGYLVTAPTPATMTAPSGMTSGISTPAGIPNPNRNPVVGGDRMAPLSLRDLARRAGG